MRFGGFMVMLGLASFAVTQDDFVGSVISRCLQGVGFGLFMAPAMAYVTTRLTPERFIHYFGIAAAMAPLPQALGPLGAEWVLAHYGPVALFILGAVPALLALPLLWALRSAEKTEKTGSYAKTLMSPRVRLPLVGVVVFGAMFGFVTAFMAAILTSREISVASFFTSYTLVLFGTRFGFLGLVERIDRRIVVGGGLTLLGIAMALLSVASSVPAVVVAGVIFGLGHSTGYPVISAWICEGVAPADRATPMAIFNAAFSVGISGSPLVTSWFVVAVGYPLVMQGLAALSIVMAAVMAAAFFSRPRAAL
jgi:MFS family permease